MNEFFAICEYFNITPIEFFNEDVNNPHLLGNVVADLQQLNDEDLDLIHKTIQRLLK